VIDVDRVLEPSLARFVQAGVCDRLGAADAAGVGKAFTPLESTS